MPPDLEAPADVPAEVLVKAAVGALPHGRLLLAVSGGRDSMVLLHAAHRAGLDVAAVATFDHGTGPASRRAARWVEREAERLGFVVVSGEREAGAADSEAVWREARHAFLRGWAAEFRASTVTAHSRDDQIETIAMRILRGSGVRGLAGMAIDSGPLRPFLTLSRARIAACAAAWKVRWVEDPSNQRRDFLRNRVRHDLLPALERVDPGFGESLHAVGEAAAEWRREVEQLVDRLEPTVSDGAVVVRREALDGFDAAGLAVVWPALAARAGVALDRRGTARLVAFTRSTGRGGMIPLAGGATVTRTARTWVVRPDGPSPRLYYEG